MGINIYKKFLLKKKQLQTNNEDAVEEYLEDVRQRKRLDFMYEFDKQVFLSRGNDPDEE